MRTGLRIVGTSRAAEDPRTLFVALNREPSDQDLRDVHDYLLQMPRAIAAGVVGRPFEMDATGADINKVLQMVARFTDVGDRQLTTMAVALVVGCISCGVSKDGALQILAKLFDEPPELVPLEMGEN
jgi:hypothetical protein